MKIESMKLIVVFLVVLSLISLFSSFAGSEINSDADQAQATQCYSDIELDYSSETKFTISLTRLASIKMTTGNKDDLSNFRRCLEKIKRKPLSLEQYKQILFLQAETDFKLERYESAFQSYFQLKLLIKDKSDTMLQQIDRRINEAEEKAKSDKTRNIFKKKLESIEKEHFKLLIVPLGLLIILLFVGKLFKDWDRRKYSSFEKASDFYQATIETKLIGLDRMRKHDGRVTKRELENYQKPDVASSSADGTDQRTAIARLIDEGYKMIERVNKLAPYPIAFISRISMINKLPYFWQYTIIGFLLIGLQAIACDYISDDYKISEKLVLLFLTAALVISSLTCLRTMAKVTINALDEVVSMLEAPDNKNSSGQTPASVLLIEKSIDFLFRSPWQFFVIVVVFFIIIIKFVVGGNSGTELVIRLIIALPLLPIVCPIIWLLIGSVFVLNSICRMEDLAINPLSPLKTMGLQKLTSVIGTYALSSSIVLSFGCSIPVLTWYIEKGSAGSWFWYILVMPFLFFYWIYPYLKISSMVKQQKEERMQLIKNKILHIFKAWIDFEEKQPEVSQKTIEKQSDEEFDELLVYPKQMSKELKPYLETMNNYYEIFKKIDESPQSHINFSSILELGKAMGIPSLFAILSAWLLS